MVNGYIFGVSKCWKDWGSLAENLMIVMIYNVCDEKYVKERKGMGNNSLLDSTSFWSQLTERKSTSFVVGKLIFAENNRLTLTRNRLVLYFLLYLLLCKVGLN